MGSTSPLNHRLGRHFAACAAVTTALAQHASAEVITFPINQVVGATIDGLYVNVENGLFFDGTNADANFPGWDINPYGSTSMSFFWSGTTNGASAGVRLNTVAGGTTSGTVLANLPAGFVIGPQLVGGASGASFGTGSASFTTTSQGKWNFNALNYFGFRFTTSAGTVMYGYGVMQMGATAATRTLVSVSYENTGGAITIPGAGPYDPCATANPTLSAGSNTVAYRNDATVGNLSTSCGTINKANYYRFTAAASGLTFVDTCSGTQDTFIAVLNGCSPGSAVLACNNDTCGTSSRVSFTATAGTTYFVAVGSPTTTDLTGTVNVAVTAPYAPCATTNPAITAIGSNSLAMNQLTAPNLTVGGLTITKANYFKFTPSATGTWTFSTCGTNAATRMAVLADCVTGAAVLGSDDNGCGAGSSASRVSASLTAAVPVYVVVGGEGADIPSPIAVVVAGPPLPACVSATTATYGDNAIDSTLGGATSQTVFADAAQVATSIVYKPQWFRFTPTATGQFTIKTCQSGDTKLGIGTACPTVGANFSTIAFNDDAPGCPSTAGGTSNFGSWIDATNNGATGTFGGFPLTQNLVAGTTYYICVGGFGTTTVVLGQLNISGPQGSPCRADLNNDTFVDGNDLGILLGQWGQCSSSCSADFNNDGFVDGNDLGVLLAAWGACP